MKLIAALLLACLAIPLPAQQARPERTLQYAIVVTRHGVRAPTWTLKRLNQYSASSWPEWGVDPSFLTPHGRRLMTAMGAFYRAYFSARGLLGQPNCADAQHTYFWADTDQRTLETARALTEGVLPGCQSDIHSLAAGTDDPLFHPVDVGVGKFDTALGLAAVQGRIGPDPGALLAAHRPAFDVLTHVLNGDGKAARSLFDEPFSLAADKGDLAMSGPLRIASTFTENLLLEYTNGMSGDKLGWGRLNAANLRQMMTLHTAYADLMRRTPYLARAGASNMLSHVLRSLEQAVNGKQVKGALGGPKTALAIVSGHDTNLSNLSGMLGLSWVLPSYQPDDIPPGGALIFSLWRENNTGRFAVTLQFAGQTLDQMHDATALSLAQPPAMVDVFVPGCSRATAGYACEWESFRKTATGAMLAEFVAEK